MKVIEISSEKQENGLWGTPFSCFSMDSCFNENELLKSALIMSISETWNDTFKIFNSTKDGFTVKIGNKRNIVVYYFKYEIIDNTLYEFEDEKEHKIFLRKNKLKQLIKK